MNQQWHDEFVALCALFPSGQLSEEEWALLQVHLAYCAPCRAVFRRYEHLTKNVMPVVAAIAYSDSDFDPETPSFSLNVAEQRLMSELNTRPTDREPDRRRTTKWQIHAVILAVCALAVAGLISFLFVRSKQLTASTKQPGGTCMAMSGSHCVTQASDPTLAPRQVPAKTLPVPTDVSPEMQKIIAAPLRAGWDVLWKTGEEWRAAANAAAAKMIETLPAMRERLHVTVKPSTMDGVRVYVVTPDVIPPEHRDKLLIHVHGGCYELSPGEAGTSEAIMMAGLGHFKVISVDYRMPPEAYFPGALDDAMTVYKATLKTSDPKNLAVFGTSAGGALVLEMMLRAKQLGLRMPGAIAPGTPMSDVTKTGDSFYTNELVDNVLVSRDGFCDAATMVYANGHDLNDPLLSPVYGDMHGFPPAILSTGTRDLLLSNTVRVHRKLREAGVEAELEVYEGQSHAQYSRDDRLPETREAFWEIAAFFDKHLGH